MRVRNKTRREKAENLGMCSVLVFWVLCRRSKAGLIENGRRR